MLKTCFGEPPPGANGTLAAEVGVSRRMIAYYEAESEYPPTALLPRIAAALQVSADQLLGMEKIAKTAWPSNTRMERRLREIDRLDTREKRQVLQILDTFLENAKLKRGSANGARRPA